MGLPKCSVAARLPTPLPRGLLLTRLLPLPPLPAVRSIAPAWQKTPSDAVPSEAAAAAAAAAEACERSCNEGRSGGSNSIDCGGGDGCCCGRGALRKRSRPGGKVRSRRRAGAGLSSPHNAIRVLAQFCPWSQHPLRP